jgi:hypothetical protein
MEKGVASAMAASRSSFVVVAFRVSLSASLADSVEIRGKWRTVTQQPRKAAIICTDRRIIDADWSLVISNFSGVPAINDSLTIR